MVEGEAGVGKTRLIKSFLDSALARQRAVVLVGSCFRQFARGYQPLPQLLLHAATDEGEAVTKALAGLDGDDRSALVLLQPELRQLQTGAPAPPPTLTTERRQLELAVGRFFDRLRQSAASSATVPLVIFVDDLHRAGEETLGVLLHLVERLAGAPCWILAAYRPGGLGDAHPLRGLTRDPPADGRVTRLELARLAPATVSSLASALVPEPDAGPLAELLARSGQGLPLAIAEWINFLWDEGVLVPGRPGEWQLTGPLDRLSVPDSSVIGVLVARRLRRLPASTRRLANLAAVIGQTFEVELLQAAADEHLTVVEVGLEVLLERWLIRRFADVWTPSQPQPSLTLWNQGVRRGRFEFASQLIWQAIYDQLGDERRREMHREVAQALIARYDAAAGANDDEHCELLAFHLECAELWKEALPRLEQAARKAARVAAIDVANAYYERCLYVLEHIEASAPDQRQAWQQERARLSAAQRRLTA